MQRRRFPLRRLLPVGRIRFPRPLSAGRLGRLPRMVAAPGSAGPDAASPRTTPTHSAAVIPSSPQQARPAVPVMTTTVAPPAHDGGLDDAQAPEAPEAEQGLQRQELPEQQWGDQELNDPESLPHFMRPRRAVPKADYARRARRVIKLIAVGVLFAVAGGVSTVASSWTLVHGRLATSLWPASGNLASMLVAVASLLQLGTWVAAEREWSGRKVFNFPFWLPVSSAARLASIVSALWLTVAAMYQVSTTDVSEASWWMVVGGAACSVIGATLAGVQRFHADPVPLPPPQRRTSKR